MFEIYSLVTEEFRSCGINDIIFVIIFSFPIEFFRRFLAIRELQIEYLDSAIETIFISICFWIFRVFYNGNFMLKPLQRPLETQKLVGENKGCPYSSNKKSTSIP